MANTQNGPQFARIEQPFGTESPNVHCPICGKTTIDYDSDAVCEHLAFIYVSEGGAFIYTSKDFQKRTRLEDIEGYSSDDLESLIYDADYKNELLVLEITHGGMACGPVWCTIVFGFDYGACT